MAEETATAMGTSTARTAVANRACSECNRKKTKCDMRRPGCGLCSRTGDECTYPVRRRAAGEAGLARRKSRTETLRTTRAIHRLVQLMEQEAQESDPVEPPPPTDRSTFVLPGSAFGPPPAIEEAHRLVATAAPGLQDRMPLPWPPATGPCARPGDCSRSMVLHLVDLFFDKVQPWLPILHKPRFSDFLREKLQHGNDALASLPANEAVLLASMMALSTRFLSAETLAGFPCAEWEQAYVVRAQHLYAEARNLETYDLMYLQGSIVLAYYFYSSGLSAQGWILVGVCVRLAYDFGLSETDADDQRVEPALDWVYMEECRRAWWLVWELDTFGSFVCKKPYAIDRGRFFVLLPVSDEAWFAGEQVSSVRLPTEPESSWAGLRNSPNQAERAWYLVALSIMSRAAGYLQTTRQLTPERQSVMDNEISCLRLALPPSLRLQNDTASSGAASGARRNWMVGTQLALSGASFITDCLSIGTGERDGNNLDMANFSRLVHARAFDFSRIASRWPTDHILAAHPLFCFLLLTPHVPATEPPVPSPLASSSREVVQLILSHVADVWKIGSIAHRELWGCSFQAQAGHPSDRGTGIEALQTSNGMQSMDESDLKLIVRYSLWFPLAMKKMATSRLATAQRTQQEQYRTMPGHSRIPDSSHSDTGESGLPTEAGDAPAGRLGGLQSTLNVFEHAVSPFWDLDGTYFDFSMTRLPEDPGQDGTFLEHGDL